MLILAVQRYNFFLENKIFPIFFSQNAVFHCIWQQKNKGDSHRRLPLWNGYRSLLKGVSKFSFQRFAICCHLKRKGVFAWSFGL